MNYVYIVTPNHYVLRRIANMDAISKIYSLLVIEQHDHDFSDPR
jgi:hypothetical protein